MMEEGTVMGETEVLEIDPLGWVEDEAAKIVAFDNILIENCMDSALRRDVVVEFAKSLFQMREPIVDCCCCDLGDCEEDDA